MIPTTPDTTQDTVAPNLGTEPNGRTGLLSDAERLAAILATQNAIATSELNLDSLMQLIVERTLQLTCAEGVALELREGEEMVYRAVSGTTTAFQGLRLSIHASLSGHAVLTGDILKCDDSEIDARVDRVACQKVGARSMIVVPLRYQNQVQGVLKVLASSPRYFQDADIQTLELMAGLFGAVMSHATSFRTQREIAEVQAQALATVQEQQDLQSRLFETTLSWIADYVFVCDLEGRITYANRARLKFWQRELKDVLGKNFYELGYQPELAARIHAEIATVIATREPLRAEATYKTVAGSAGYFDYILVPVLDAEGKVNAVAGSTRDISATYRAERALRATEERLRLATEAAELGIWAWEPATDTVLWENDRMYAIYGLSPADPVLTSAQFLSQVVHPDDAQMFAKAISLPLQTGEALYFEGRFYRQDGVLRWIEFRGRLQPAANNEPSRVVGTAADITDRKQAEQILVAYMREIEGLNHRLRRSMRETHHRVKNNLQVISAMIEMQVLEHLDDEIIPLDEFRRLKTHIHTLAIVHDLLTVSLKEEEETQRVSTRAVLEKLLPMLQQMAWKQNVRYTVDEVDLTSKQCIALALILNELVSNALKHGKKQAEVLLTAQGQSVRLTVCDDGDGFPVDFDAVASANTGLELVDSLVRTDLQGTIHFGNGSQGGGLVIVTFPLPSYRSSTSAT